MPSSFVQFFRDILAAHGLTIAPQYAADFRNTVGRFEREAVALDQGFAALPQEFRDARLAQERTSWGRRVLEAVVAPSEARAAGIKAQIASIMATAEGNAAFVPPKDPAERDAFLLRVSEMRADLRGFDADARAFVYATTTDPEVLYAIETAPPVFVKLDDAMFPIAQPFVDPAKIAAARLERVRAQNAPAVAQIEDLERVAGAFQTIAAGIRQIVYDRVPGVRAQPDLRDPSTGKALAAVGSA